MRDEYYALGEVLPDLDPCQLAYDESRRVLAACKQHPAFEVVELRWLKRAGSSDKDLHVVDGIVVECCDGSIPSRNSVGIKNRERLLLLHGPGLLTPHEVRALRVNFPLLPHQNHVPDGEPASLCLYFEPWSAVERTWTPEKHLQRILWWLRETASGTLHRSDQPLERLHFVSPYQIVLPADFNERMKTQSEVLRLAFASPKIDGTLWRGMLASNNEAKVDDYASRFAPLVVQVPPALATRIERYPATLKDLHDQLAGRGSEFIGSLIAAVKMAVPRIGLPIHDSKVQHTLLLLLIPLIRSEGATPERIDVEGFVVYNTNLASLGTACGAALEGKNGKAYANPLTLLGATGTGAFAAGAWRNLAVEPVEVRRAFTPVDARKASGISNESAEFQGVLAGVGALGSCMADLWSRTGWGHWSYIDDDILHAHNIVRHSGRDEHIGWAKVDVMQSMAKLNWPTAPIPKAIAARVNDSDNPDVNKAILAASLLVDATTTLEVPRELSVRDDMPRMVSAFLTPSGRDCVLLLEDAARKVRLNSLEAQYYRAILNSAWGPTHLTDPQGTYWVGAGCRDLSGVLSQEVVQLHGATLARQIRVLSASPNAQIRVWSLHEGSGALAVDLVSVATSLQRKLGDWTVIWDEYLAAKLKALRKENLPNETGGVILGYIDQKCRAIHIVDVLSEPSDSKSSRISFVRGVNGVKEAIEQASKSTAYIVDYIGEWHSHPEYSSSIPSQDDDLLLTNLAQAMEIDGVPALMIIVGEYDTSIFLKESSSK